MATPKAGYVMRCHYEVLEIERNANETEIRKAYRKLALRWHPDKNMDNHDEADRRFKEISSAYETLSDAHERSWYDSHREAILRGGDGTAEGGGGEGAVSSVPNVWKWYGAGAYSGFGEEEDSFYNVYENAFQEIHEAEMASVPPSEEEMHSSPPFGTPTSSENDVRAFYAFWDVFVSRVLFSWCDKYNLADADSRWVRRKMEQENKRARMAEKKKYVDLVRNLVSFVKKRDPRMKKFVQEHEERQRARKEAQRVAEMERKEKFKLAKEEWKQQRAEELAREQREIEEQGLFRLADEDQQAEDNRTSKQVFRCDACSKTFKSEKQLSNHCNSKKHKEEMRKLINQLRKEEELALRMMKEEEEAAAAAALSEGEVSLDVEQNEMEEESDSEVEESDTDSSDSDSSSDDDAFLSAFASMGKKTKAVEHSSESEDDENQEDILHQSNEQEDSSIDLEDVVERDSSEDASEGACESSTVLDANDISTEESDVKEEPTPSTEVGAATEGTDHQADWKCTICSEMFASRNKLFKHIKDSGHAALKTQGGGGKKQKNRGKKKGKKTK